MGHVNPTSHAPVLSHVTSMSHVTSTYTSNKIVFSGTEIFWIQINSLNQRYGFISHLDESCYVCTYIQFQTTSHGPLLYLSSHIHLSRHPDESQVQLRPIPNYESWSLIWFLFIPLRHVTRTSQVAREDTSHVTLIDTPHSKLRNLNCELIYAHTYI